MIRKAWMMGLVCVCAGAAVADTHYVDANSSAPSAPYTNWTSAATVIQDAVDAASSNDTVLVTNGTYFLTSEITVTNLTVQSVNGADVTIVDGQDACRGFYLDHSTIRGFTVTNGYADGGEMSSRRGGGIYTDHGRVENCVVSGNTASFSGGGIYNHYGVVEDCVVNGNTAEGAQGGGIYMGDVYSCVISGNTAATGGGGVRDVHHLHSCLIIGNHAGTWGGGAENCVAWNCTVVSNTAVEGGGGVSDGGVYNSIVWYNTSTNNDNNIYSGGVCRNTCSPDVSNGSSGCITNNPLMNADYTLQVYSPCINRGNNEYVDTETDTAGNPRIAGITVDMGSYEATYNVVYADAAQPDDSGVGLSWATATKTIQTAVDFADDGSTILITNGTYALTSHVAVTNAVIIESVNGPEVTIVDGQDTCRGFHLGTNACTLSGLTITNGYAAGEAGGGVYCSDTTPVITNCIVSGNLADFDGGGVNGGTIIDSVLSGNTAGDEGGGTSYSDVKDSMLNNNTAHNSGGGSYYGTLTNCTLNANAATTNGGGAYYGTLIGCLLDTNAATNNGGGTCYGTLIDCTLTANTSGHNGGGAYHADLSDCTFATNTAAVNGGGAHDGTATNCTFTGNEANGYGGGACNMALTDCTLDGNGADNHGGGASGCVLVRCILDKNTTAQNGGGAYQGVLENCLLTGNVATNYGGGACDATLSSCTLKDNSSAYRGGGVSGGTQENCVVWGNTAADTGNDIYSGTNSYTCASDGVIPGAAGSITNNPLFIGAGDFDLSPDSPCINSGNSAVAPDGPDLAGNRRISGSAIDMGAYEFIYTAVYVDDARPDNTGNGFSWATAKKSIQAGVDISDAIVWVTNGTYALTSDIDIDRAMTVQSVNGRDVTMVDGQGSVRCFNLRDIACTISGFTITNGHSSHNGGGVRASGYNPIITNCILTGNSADNDGGGSDLGTLNNCVLRGNTAHDGGGAYRSILNGCIITGNTATSWGGGASSSSVHWGELNHCIISGNSATYGGGTFNKVLNNCLLINNTASEEGGGACNGFLYNCTLSGNTAGTYGGGVSKYYYPLEMYNCVVWGNTAGDQGNDIYILGLMPPITHICASDGITNGIDHCITNAPDFMDAASGNYRLKYGSPCIDTGNNSKAPGTTDLAGNVRIVDGNSDGTNTVDMGATEYHSGYDSDGDAMDDGDETIADTDPLNSNDYFRVTSISNGMVFFDSSNARWYTLLGCTNLVSSDWKPVQGARMGLGGADFLQSTNNLPVEFYKLEVKLP